MIQRIQTVYLLITVVLISLIYFFPFAYFVVEQDMSMYHISIQGLISETTGAIPLFRVIPIIIIVTFIVLIGIVSLLLFKRRIIQIKLCIINIVLMVGLQGLIYYYISVSKHQLGSITSFSFIFILPIVSAILTYLAIRRIAKDEALVRSMDRLR